MSTPSAPSTSRLDGKIALVTGSGRGMGRQNALELASRGASLVINYSRASGAAEAVVREIEKLGSRAVAIAADVSKPAEVATLFEKAISHYGKLDIVVSNSGVESFGHISEITVEEFDRVFSVNTRGQLLVAQQAYKHLEKGGRLVMLSSISASAKGVPNHSIYSGSKGAVEAFARCLAVDFGSKGITVNAIAPGGIKTDMYIEAARKYIPNEASMTDTQIDELAASWSPLNRVGMPQDVSRVVAFLCSQDGEWMNGQVLAIGGGAAL
ncbi:Elsinochrome reductase 1 [Imshaugia aleurites]|uniref:Elsinochrome reductase 1 n=1 Tax=Imshaugia aleurites TaxID=172621 RepID=A0A8H3I7M6_9LECA|nr:Elsinochrome reductase 1 [Imshaugia aleurites]